MELTEKATAQVVASILTGATIGLGVVSLISMRREGRQLEARHPTARATKAQWEAKQAELAGTKPTDSMGSQTCHHLSPRQLNILKQAGNVRSETLDKFFREPLTFAELREMYNETLEELGRCDDSERRKDTQMEVKYRRSLLKADKDFWVEDRAKARKYSDEALGCYNMRRERDKLHAIMMSKGIK